MPQAWHRALHVVGATASGTARFSATGALAVSDVTVSGGTAPSYVGKVISFTYQEYSGPAAIPVQTAPAATSLVLGICVGAAGNDDTINVTDSKGNTWTNLELKDQSEDSTWTLSISYTTQNKAALTTSDTINSQVNNGDAYVVFYEIGFGSGLETWDANEASGDSVATSVTTSDPHDLVVAICLSTVESDSFTMPAGFTQEDSQSPTGNGALTYAMAVASPGSAGSQTTTWADTAGSGALTCGLLAIY